MKLTPPSSWRLGKEGLNHHEFKRVFQAKKWYVGRWTDQHSTKNLPPLFSLDKTLKKTKS